MFKLFEEFDQSAQSKMKELADKLGTTYYVVELGEEHFYVIDMKNMFKDDAINWLVFDSDSQKLSSYVVVTPKSSTAVRKIFKNSSPDLFLITKFTWSAFVDKINFSQHSEVAQAFYKKFVGHWQEPTVDGLLTTFNLMMLPSDFGEDSVHYLTSLGETNWEELVKKATKSGKFTDKQLTALGVDTEKHRGTIQGGRFNV
jgi:hypothetical protein